MAAGAGADHSFGRLWELVMARTTELVVFLAGLLLSAAAEEAETYASRLIQNDHLGYIIEEPKLQVCSLTFPNSIFLFFKFSANPNI